MRTHLVLLSGLLIIMSCNSDDEPGLNPPLGEHRLKSVAEYFETSLGFSPSDSTAFKYNSEGQLIEKKYFTYDVFEDEFALFSIEDFSYTDGKLSLIEKEIVVTNGYTTRTEYEYSNDKITRIHLDDHTDTEAILSYPHKDTVEIRYNTSNGNFFTYRFSTVDHNIHFEETYDEGENLASETINEFDNRINPYSLLGYTDLFFTNFSKNNKTKTDSEYYAIGFPDSVPFSYEYVYNQDNLPVQQLITYKTYPNGHISARAKVLFQYE